MGADISNIMPNIVAYLSFGVFFILSGIFNWQWMFSNRRGFLRWLASSLGRTGTRFFYGFSGVALIGTSIFMFFTV